MVDLCKEFEKQARRVWLLLKKAQSIGYQPKEETITDLNIIELRKRCSRQVITHEFTRHQEAKTGSDWEWWFTDSGKQWIGFRVQAKILHLKTSQFRQLHYHKQLETLIKRAEHNTPPLIPIYCLYIFETPPKRGDTILSDFNGCSILWAHQAKQIPQDKRSLAFVKRFSPQPWHRLFDACMHVFRPGEVFHDLGTFNNPSLSRSPEGGLLLSDLAERVVAPDALPTDVQSILLKKSGFSISSKDEQAIKPQSSRSRPDIVTFFSNRPLT